MRRDSQLNVYVVGDDLSPRQRQRLQAQLETALQALPRWCFDLLRDRLAASGAQSFPLVVEPQPALPARPGSRAEGPAGGRQAVPTGRQAVPTGRQALPLSLGRLQGRPAAYLRPRLNGDPSTGLRTGTIDWLQDRRYLVAKAVAHMAAPGREEDAAFWQRWAQAVKADGLRARAAAQAEAWASASDGDLLIEMFAAYALSPTHRRWRELPAVRAFLEGWGGDAVE